MGEPGADAEAAWEEISEAVDGKRLGLSGEDVSKEVEAAQQGRGNGGAD